MVVKTIVATVVFIFLYSCFVFGDDLIMVHVLWRHGDRSPGGLIPTDVNNTESTWPQGLGELSPDGMRQEFLLGQVLNQRYSGKLLSENYVQPEIYVRADDYNRTLMSAMANLAGLYSNSSAGVDVPGWPAPYWQPIPVHTVSLNQDNLLYMDAPCPKADEIQSTDVNQPEYIKYTKEFQPLFTYLDSVCGFSYNLTIDSINNVFDPLNCELVHHDDHTWPSYINGSTFEQIRIANNIGWDFEFTNPTVARLRGGNLLGDIINRMKQKQTSLDQINDNSLDWVRKLKMYMYSAHDSTVSAFMSTLGAELFTGGQPGYSASVLIELWSSETKDNYYIKTYYRQNTSSEYFEFQVDGCPPSYCSLTTFQNRSISFIPIDWYKECAMGFAPKNVSPLTFMVFSLAFLAYFCKIYV